MHVSPHRAVMVDPNHYGLFNRGMSGFGDIGDIGDINIPGIVGASGGLIAGGAAIGVASGAIAAGGALATIGAFAGPIGAVAGILVGIFMRVFSGCGATCTISSEDADAVESALKQNVSAYDSSGHTASEQQAALANFDYAWSKLVAACSNPQLGAAGQRCISERQRGGSAKWQCQCPNHSAGSNGQCSGCDWFVLYRDPIANDPHVMSDAQPGVLPGATTTEPIGTAMVDGTSVSSSSFSMSPILLVGIAAVLLLMGGSK